jgi:3-dehydroquinate synthase
LICIDRPGYPIWIGSGLLSRLDALLPPGRYYLVTDENVLRCGWTEPVERAAGARLIGRHVLTPGEANKNLARLERLLDAMIEAGVQRSDHVVAVGGGMVGDIAGFAAAVLKRGCGFICLPTSLLAQADSAIGGKTAVNAAQGKNLIGAFHRPAAVVIDTATLATLPARELRAGYAEVVKYGLIGDAGFFAWCEEHGRDLIAGDEAARLHAVETSVRAKAEIVARDERDTAGRRALLNFGHSFGHAIEAESGLAHGEAVALGMALACRLSAERGLCQPAEARRVEHHLASVGLPTRLAGFEAKALVARMAHDKKRQGAGFRLVLVRRIGEALVEVGITAVEVEDFLEREIASARIGVG